MTIEQLLDLVMTSRLRELHTALPCRVESYNASKQTADVLPMIKRQVPDGDGGYTLEDLPVLPNVPVAFPRGGGGFFMSFPLQKGDFVFVVFSERAIGAWRQKGQATTPGDLRMHSLAGAVALPCLYPSDDALDDAHASNMVLGKDGSTAQIHLKSDGTVHLGGENGAQFVALATDVLNRLSAIVNTFNGHQHAETGGTTGLPTVAMSSPASVAASKVKAT
jgi:hypothetical protein